MTANRAYRFGSMAGVVAVGGVLLFFTGLKHSNSTETPPAKPVANQYREKVKSSHDQLAPDISGEHSVIVDYSRSERDSHENDTRVSIDLNAGGGLLVAVEATVQEVLDSLVANAHVEVVDRRPDDERTGATEQLRRQSFRISGSVEDVLHMVMAEYNYSYVISHNSSADPQSQSPVIKLFVFGVTQSEGPILETSTKEEVDISELLRTRALSSAGSNSMQEHSLAIGSSSYDNEPVTGYYDNENDRPSLADMTRRASREVQALAEGLKQAEKMLNAQHNTEYSESSQ